MTMQKVQPGDLITASFVNTLIDQLAALDGRVSALEGALPGNAMLQIFAPLVTDTYHVGDELRIVGQGFGITALNTVTFDGTTRVNTFKTGSNDNLLIIDIPNLTLPAQGKQVTLSVSNNAGFAQTSFTLLPAVATVPTGQLFLNQQQTAQQLVQNPGFSLFFTLAAGVTLADTYRFAPVFGGAATAGWDAWLADPNDSSGQVPAKLSSDIQVAAQGSAKVRVWVQVPQNAPQGSAVTLAITFASKANPTTVKSATTGQLTLTVGQPAPGAEKVGVATRQVVDKSATLINPDAGGVYSLPVAKAPASFFFLVSSAPGAAAANYTVTAALDASASGWGTTPAVVVDPPGGKLLNFIGQRQVQVNVTPANGAQPTNVTVRVSLDSDTAGTTGHVTLAIRAV